MKGTLLAPDKIGEIPDNAKWLAGEGAGAWFVLEKDDNLEQNEYRFRRYASDGTLHCDRIFKLEKGDFNVLLPFEFSYPSHCLCCTVIQLDKEVMLRFKKENS